MAQRLLRKSKYKILHCGFEDHQGEIDIVAVDGRTVVFVEVKTRSTDQAGLPASAVDEAKQKKIAQTAKSYLRRFHLDDYQIRFDVVAILLNPQGQPQIDHLIDAFREVD